jgi:hypothetical protein
LERFPRSRKIAGVGVGSHGWPGLADPLGDLRA